MSTYDTINEKGDYVLSLVEVGEMLPSEAIEFLCDHEGWSYSIAWEYIYTKVGEL